VKSHTIEWVCGRLTILFLKSHRRVRHRQTLWALHWTLNKRNLCGPEAVLAFLRAASLHSSPNAVHTQSGQKFLSAPLNDYLVQNRFMSRISQTPAGEQRRDTDTLAVDHKIASEPMDIHLIPKRVQNVSTSSGTDQQNSMNPKDREGRGSATQTARCNVLIRQPFHLAALAVTSGSTTKNIAIEKLPVD
jgi:hypothetical protein